MNSIKIFRYTDDNKNVLNEYTDTHATVEIDYNGNVYVMYNDIYYIILLDSDNINGLELIKIDNTKYYTDIFNENKHLFTDTSMGTIVSSNCTLSGKIYDQLNEMTDEDKSNFSFKNNYDFNDSYFIENKYYRVKYDHEYTDDNIVYRLNSISTDKKQKGIMLSQLLSPTCSSFDTIYIDGELISKNIVSSSERMDGCCSSRLTIYSSGYIRCNFIDKIIISKLCIIDSELTIKTY